MAAAGCEERVERGGVGEMGMDANWGEGGWEGEDGEWGGRTLCLLEHPLDGAGAAAAGHGDVEFVVVLGLGVWGHCGED